VTDTAPIPAISDLPGFPPPVPAYRMPSGDRFPVTHILFTDLPPSCPDVTAVTAEDGSTVLSVRAATEGPQRQKGIRRALRQRRRADG
jgi:hypothetical protein